MYNRNAVNANIRMTSEEISKAKSILAQRNAQTMKNGFEEKWCAPEFRSYYHPASETGRQIYLRYTDDELLDILISYMQHQGHSPDWEKIHHVYKLYLSYRFGDLAQAKAKARSRQKALTQQNKWPPDWPERVSAEPLYQWLGECGKAYTNEDIAVVEGICARAKESRCPPDLSSEVCRHLGKFGDIKKVLEKMNIPPLRKSELRFMTRYWAENQAK